VVGDLGIGQIPLFLAARDQRLDLRLFFQIHESAFGVGAHRGESGARNRALYVRTSIDR
jgi:hypothetical protein